MVNASEKIFLFLLLDVEFPTAKVTALHCISYLYYCSQMSNLSFSFSLPPLPFPSPTSLYNIFKCNSFYLLEIAASFLRRASGGLFNCDLCATVHHTLVCVAIIILHRRRREGSKAVATISFPSHADDSRPSL